MKKSLLSKPLLIAAIISPLVIFQGAPELMPKEFLELYAGVPGTVLATSAWFVIMVAMAWVFGRSNTDYTGEDQS